MTRAWKRGYSRFRHQTGNSSIFLCNIYRNIYCQYNIWNILMKWGLPLSNLGDTTNVRNRTATDTGFHSEFFYFFIYGFSWAVMVAMKRLQLNNAAIMSLIIFFTEYMNWYCFDVFNWWLLWIYVLLNIFPWNTIKAGTSTHVEPIAVRTSSQLHMMVLCCCWCCLWSIETKWRIVSLSNPYWKISCTSASFCERNITAVEGLYILSIPKF